jgi:hypothetical protein
MSVRLNVLLVQSPRMSGLQSGINADVVFQLMGVPGIDLSIVNSLNPTEIAETDRLLLSSLQNDLAVLDWRDADNSLSALAILGVSGMRAPHQLDPNTSAVQLGKRRIYLVDLRSGDSPAAVVNAMKDLLDQRRVVAVPLSIGGLPKPKVPAVTKPVSAPPVVAQPTPTPQQTKTPPVTANGPHPDPGQATVRREPSDRELDALVDGLNAGDW